MILIAGRYHIIQILLISENDIFEKSFELWYATDTWKIIHPETKESRGESNLSLIFEYGSFHIKKIV